MLVITRPGEAEARPIIVFHAGERLEVRVWASSSGRVKAGFKGPHSFVVLREEIVAEANHNNELYRKEGA